MNASRCILLFLFLEAISSPSLFAACYYGEAFAEEFVVDISRDAVAPPSLRCSHDQLTRKKHLVSAATAVVLGGVLVAWDYYGTSHGDDGSANGQCPVDGQGSLLSSVTVIASALGATLVNPFMLSSLMGDKLRKICVWSMEKGYHCCGINDLLRDGERQKCKTKIALCEAKINREIHRYPDESQKSLRYFLASCWQHYRETVEDQHSSSDLKTLKKIDEILEVIEVVLNLAIPRPPLRGEHKAELLAGAQEKAATLFANTQPEIKKLLNDIAKKIYGCSAQNSKTVYYFQGDPGTGKTRTAKLLAECFDLPLILVSFAKDVASDRSSSQEDSFFYEHQKSTSYDTVRASYMARSFAQAKGRTPAIVLFDEAGNLLVSSKNEYLANQMLEFFDTSKLEAVFKELLGVKVNLVEDFIFILTGNRELPQRREALATRVPTIKFSRLEKTCMTTIALAHAKKVLRDPQALEDEAFKAKIREIAEFNSRYFSGVRTLETVVEAYVRYGENLGLAFFPEYDAFDIGEQFKRFTGGKELLAIEAEVEIGPSSSEAALAAPAAEMLGSSTVAASLPLRREIKAQKEDQFVALFGKTRTEIEDELAEEPQYAMVFIIVNALKRHVEEKVGDLGLRIDAVASLLGVQVDADKRAEIATKLEQERSVVPQTGAPLCER